MSTRYLRFALLLSAVTLGTASMLQAQNAAPNPAVGQAFTLREAVDYAVKNNLNVANAQIDVQSARDRVNEVKAIGLPQLSVAGLYTNNLIIPRFFVKASTFNPAAPPDEVQAVKFGINHNASGNANLSQLLFDGSYLIGLKAASVYIELARKNLAASKITVAENVTKAYYSVLVNEEQLGLLNTNVARLDSLLRETTELNRQGLAEKLDVQRIEVQRNNLRSQVQNVERLQELSVTLLKFQMGYPLNEPIGISEKLAKADFSDPTVLDVSLPFNYASRIEYSTLQVQRALQELDVRNITAGYYPNLRLTGNYGYASGSDVFSGFFNRPWFNQASVSLALNIPIFDGFSKKYRIAQSRNTLLKIDNSRRLLEQSIDLQLRQSQTQLRNQWFTLQEQKKNLDLSNEILRVTRIKYKEGVGANIEVINAEASFREAQTNYYNALYNALVAKVDLDKAAGRLYTE
jgi:outer membrane protein TolC